jgi:hypothetical protein
LGMPARSAQDAGAAGLAARVDGGLSTRRIGLADLMQVYGFAHPHKKEMHKAFDEDSW